MVVMTKTSLLLTPFVAGLLAAGLGACGGQEAGAGGPSAPGDPATENVADDKAQLAFAKCLREQGVEVSDPDGSGGGIQIKLRAKPGEAGGMTPRRLQQATKECRDKTGGGPPEPTEEQKTEMRDGALKFAKCMREHGVDMPDPQFEGDGAVLSRGPGRGGLGPDDPAFQKAEGACQKLMPRLRGGDGPSTSSSAGDPGESGGVSAEIEVPKP